LLGPLTYPFGVPANTMFVALRCFFDMNRIAQWNYDICDTFWRSAKP
jgi:hypothetical protein